ncbi:hypothetical protein MBLNU459_g5914t1 [Dothideomycetes sp. NU459]
MSSAAAPSADAPSRVNITLIGAGTIGLSFAALHLNRNPAAHITIHDPRPDLSTYVHATLPAYLDAAQHATYAARLTLAPPSSTSLAAAVRHAHIVQEQGPETLAFKQALWPAVEAACPPAAQLWSSTSGLAASAQAAGMRAPARLVVVHPFNPPHVLPVLEVVGGGGAAVAACVAYWAALGRAPVVLRRETPGFVANRLAFAVLREAAALVHAGVIGVRELDELVETSIGPRWAVKGPFASYAAGGGEGGMRSFLDKIGGTVNEAWEASEQMKVGPGGIQGWEEGIIRGCEEAYGDIDAEEVARRSRTTVAVLEAVGRGTKRPEKNAETRQT